MTTLEIRKAVLKLSNRKGIIISEKFPNEVKNFLSRIGCKKTKELKSGIRYENGPFEMITLTENEKSYFVN